MAKSKNRTNELEDYIRQVEAKEKGKKKKLFVLGFVCFAVLGGGFVPYYLQSQKSGLRTFSIDELSIYAVDSIFDVDTSRIVLLGKDGVKPDTISSTEQYIELTHKGDEEDLGLASNAYSTFSDESPQDSTLIETEKAVEAESLPKTLLPRFFFAIEGKKVVGESIHITIVDYDENVNYTIDFGNGIKKRIRKRISYAYPRAGNFLINLIATNATNASSIYTRSISINSKPAEKPPTQKPQIVDNNTATQNERKVENEAANSMVASSDNDSEDLFAEIIDNSEEETANELGSLINSEEQKPEEGEESVENMEPQITGPLISAEKMPNFPGGEAAMYKFLNRKIRYPRLARENSTEGKVYLQFVVEDDGTISNIKVLRGIGYGCDEEAVRVVRQMPRWIPGEQGGQTVPVFYTMRVTFRLQN